MDNAQTTATDVGVPQAALPEPSFWSILDKIVTSALSYAEWAGLLLAIIVIIVGARLLRAWWASRSLGTRYNQDRS